MKDHRRENTSHPTDEDRHDPSLRALPRPALTSAAEARLHARARAAFVAAPSGDGGRWLRLWTRALEPLVVVGVVGVVAAYFVWTASALGALERERAAAVQLSARR